MKSIIKLQRAYARHNIKKQGDFKMNFVNLTPHIVNLNDGRAFPPSGKVARVATEYTGDGDIRTVAFGEPVLHLTGPDGKLTGETEPLPPVQPGVVYIVSGLMAKAAIRSDFVAPATGHPEAVREGNLIKSVPFFVQGNMFLSFTPARNGGVMAKIDGIVSFPERYGPQPRHGETWEVEVSGQSKAGKVNFLRCLRRVEYCYRCQTYVDAGAVTNFECVPMCAACYVAAEAQKAEADERESARKEAHRKEIKRLFSCEIDEYDYVIVVVLGRNVYISLSFSNVQQDVDRINIEIKRRTPVFEFIDRNANLPEEVVGRAAHVEAATDDEKISIAIHSIAMEEWHSALADAERNYWAVAEGPRYEFIGWDDAPLVARDFDYGYDGGPEKIYRYFEPGKYLNTDQEKSAYQVYLDVLARKPVAS